MWYIGLDLHWRTSSVCIVNEQGTEVKKATIKGGWDKLLGWLDREVAGPYEICYEASCGYGAIYDKLISRARRVVVAHPGKLRLIFAAKRKNDRLDAAKLAMLLRMNLVSAVHVPSADVRQWRRMIEMRRALVAKRTRTKNQIRALLKINGLRSPHRLWTKKGLHWLLEEVEWPSRLAALEAVMLVRELELFQEQIAQVTRELDSRGRNEPGVILLRTIPGVGPRTAEAVVAYIDDAGRFRRSSQVGSYFGLLRRHRSARQHRDCRTVPPNDEDRRHKAALAGAAKDPLRHEMDFFAQWYNEHRPHTWLGRRTHEVHSSQLPANRAPRWEPRSRWPRGSPCAAPRTLVKGRPGARVELAVTFHEGRKHLPIVTLKRVAQPDGTDLGAALSVLAGEGFHPPQTNFRRDSPVPCHIALASEAASSPENMPFSGHSDSVDQHLRTSEHN